MSTDECKRKCGGPTVLYVCSFGVRHTFWNENGMVNLGIFLVLATWPRVLCWLWRQTLGIGWNTILNCLMEISPLLLVIGYGKDVLIRTLSMESSLVTFILWLFLLKQRGKEGFKNSNYATCEARPAMWISVWLRSSDKIWVSASLSCMARRGSRVFLCFQEHDL